MKRALTVLLALLLLVGLLPAVAVSAEEKEIILLAGSDFQTSGFSTANVERVLDTLAIHGITKADGAFFCGDYTLDKMESNTSTTGIAVLKRLFTPIVGSKMIFVQGNHDHEETVGLSRAGNNDPASGKYGAFVIREDQYREWGNDRKETEAVAEDLRSYLDQKYRSGWDKPVFVLCHIPLHWSNRTIKDGSGTDADVLFDVLNEYGEKGMNIFYLYGHNHSGGYDDFMGGGAVYLKKGDEMEVCHGVKREHQTHTLRFTYMNAGFIGYYSTDQEDTDAAITMSVFRIKGNEVIVTRYDGDFSFADGRMGIHNLKSKGVLHPNYSEEGYHAVPDNREYASSRKVTATDDVAIETPIPQETTTTTTTEATTTTMGSGIAINKTTTAQTTDTTAPTESSTTAAPTTASTTLAIEIEVTEVTGVNPTTSEESTTATTADEVGVEDTTQPTESTAVPSVPDGAPINGAEQDMPGWVWIFPVAGGMVLIASVVVLLITSKKKK